MSNNKTAKGTEVVEVRFVVANVLEMMGMDNKTAKGFATRKTKALGIIRDENGAVCKSEILSILETYSYSNTSKYAEIGNTYLKEVGKTGAIKGLSSEPSVTKIKASPFIAGKVLKLVEKEFADNKEVMDFIRKETDKLEQLELSK